ncbi:hypothetical protein [Streptomyces sp. NPDC048825]|uniref:hypothetical protein n=1 Tax=Streptomyces sp. NPDC048825 TaxID=3365592 RepID=UPI0037119299
MTERVSARLPESGEAELLGLPDGVRVLSVPVIACDASGQALQVSDVRLRCVAGGWRAGRSGT